MLLLLSLLFYAYFTRYMLLFHAFSARYKLLLLLLFYFAFVLVFSLFCFVADSLDIDELIASNRKHPSVYYLFSL